ncbi:hypothetical protein PC110_g20401 [Phytophthora cactorum]|uniref:Uncharacterized protein n=1 Tax=Phytophthora cactorum TaxID=29920 RepID=A0A329RFL6_9STRA|nr:hypothetical protein PC110_g20401 [Phytophthora cactorum]
MTKSTKNAAEATSDEDSLRAHLEEESEEGDESAPLHAATELWSRLCATLAANSHLTGVEALDRLVFKVLADDSFPVALEEVMPILPAPDLMEVGHAQDHSVVKTPTTRARIKRSSSFTPAKAPPAKQERPAKQKAKAHFSFDLPTGVDAALVRGLERIIKISEGYSKTPPRMEDPLSLLLLFLLLSLYPTTDNAADRRKLNANALQSRLQLLSAFIEDMGYYGLLTAFEDTVHDNLIRHRHPFKRRRYDKVIANALYWFEVDSHGYGSIPEKLELSQAFDPTRPKNLRLSDKALAPIALDVATGSPPKESWVPQLLTEGKPVVVHTERPFQVSEVGDDDSDFEDDGEYTALKPSAPVRKNTTCFDQEDEEDQDEAREDDEQDADEQKDEESDEEAVDQQSPSDSNATPATTADSGKANKHSKASPTPASPRNSK